MNELKESSKENTSENFCGVAFITFNTIKEQEDYLNKINKSCCSLLFDSFITLNKIYFSPFFFFAVVVFVVAMMITIMKIL